LKQKKTVQQAKRKSHFGTLLHLFERDSKLGRKLDESIRVSHLDPHDTLGSDERRKEVHQCIFPKLDDLFSLLELAALGSTQIPKNREFIKLGKLNFKANRYRKVSMLTTSPCFWATFAKCRDKSSSKRQYSKSFSLLKIRNPFMLPEQKNAKADSDLHGT
jgi:hypothetical protein